jgi:hypothetical protein
MLSLKDSDSDTIESTNSLQSIPVCQSPLYEQRDFYTSQRVKEKRNALTLSCINSKLQKGGDQCASQGKYKNKTLRCHRSPKALNLEPISLDI